MSNHLHKLRAFTIIETMVALVLTALTISFVYMGIRFARGQGETMTRRLDTFGEFNSLHRALQVDTERAGEIYCRDSVLNFHAGHRLIQYLVFDSLVIRDEGAVTDTFNIRIDSVAAWFGGGQLDGKTGLVTDHVVLYVRIPDRTMPITINKRYDAATLMRLTQPEE